MRDIPFLLVCFCTFATVCAAGNPLASEIRARIGIEATGSQIIAEGFSQNDSEHDRYLGYRFVASTSGPNGTSNSTQSGQMLARRHEETLLSKLVFNCPPGATYRFFLYIMDSETIVASDSVVYSRSFNATTN